MRPRRQCKGQPGEPCAVLTQHPSGRCEDHRRRESRRQHDELYNSPQWNRLRSRMLKDHTARFGLWCPGLPEKLIAPHWITSPNRLTLDHIVALALGGAPLDPNNLQVLCARCNEAKDAALAATFSRPQRCG